MKPEHLYPAPFAMGEPRHPRCIRATPGAGAANSLADQQAARIVELEGRLATALGREHDLANRVTTAEGFLELARDALGLPASASPPAVLDRIRRLVQEAA